MAAARRAIAAQRGRQALVRRGSRGLRERLGIEIEEFVDAGEHVVRHCDRHADVGRASGIEVQTPLAPRSARSRRARSSRAPYFQTTTKPSKPWGWRSRRCRRRTWRSCARSTTAWNAATCTAFADSGDPEIESCRDRVGIHDRQGRLTGSIEVADAFGDGWRLGRLTDRGVDRGHRPRRRVVTPFSHRPRSASGIELRVAAASLGLDDPRREGLQACLYRDPPRPSKPSGCWSSEIGDVAGERGDRAAHVEAWNR